MGYSTYWNRVRKDFNEEEWNSLIKDCKVLYKNMPKHSLSAGGWSKEDPLFINGCSGYNKAQFTNKHIIFNGGNGSKRTFTVDTKYEGKERKSWKDSIENDLDHETFLLTRKDSGNFNFCKTARKPYDLMVCAVLFLAKYHLKDKIKISSDGDMEDWKPAIEFVESLFPDYVLEIMTANNLFEK